MNTYQKKDILSLNWINLIKPSNYIIKEINSNTTVFIIEPLERGFGITLGNSIRRILLSSLQGTAICAVKILGIKHEYSSLDGIKEDVLEITLNLKSIIINGHTEFDKKIFILNVKRKGAITAGMITTPPGFSIVNPDLIICNTIKEIQVNMHFVVVSGKGYMIASDQNKELAPQYIKIDSIFSPINRCFFEVFSSRIGSKTEYDKLILTIQTNGTIEPNLALALAAKIFQEQLQVFINFKEVKEIVKPKKYVIPFNKHLLKKITDLELSVRSHNCLKNDNINYVGDLVIKSESQMLKTPNFGKKSLNEIKELLTHMNLRFGMKVDNWPPKDIEKTIKEFINNY